jgi:hypothetical protein
MSERASGLVDVVEAEDGPGPRGRGRRYALLALGLALVAGAAGLGAVVGSWAPPDPPPPAAAPSTSPAAGPAAPPTSAVRQPLELPEFRGRTVAEASAAAEAAGATPVVFDARWNRPVKPDWVVCTDGEPVRGDDTPTGEFDIAAVPAGDPCP